MGMAPRNRGETLAEEGGDGAQSHRSRLWVRISSARAVCQTKRIFPVGMLSTDKNVILKLPCDFVINMRRFAL